MYRQEQGCTLRPRSTLFQIGEVSPLTDQPDLAAALRDDALDRTSELQVELELRAATCARRTRACEEMSDIDRDGTLERQRHDRPDHHRGVKLSGVRPGAPRGPDGQVTRNDQA